MRKYEEQEAAKYNNIFFLLSPGEALNELECTYRLAISYFYAQKICYNDDDDDISIRMTIEECRNGNQ